MNKTSIQYLTHTWNPLAMRCTPISAGCAHCWHLAMANRLAGNTAFSDEVRAAYAGERTPMLIEERLTEPLRRKKPATIGVQFMGDLFHPNVPFAKMWEVWKVMRACPQHIFLVLTKRHERMAQDVPMFYHAQEELLPNTWLGVTVENQAAADARRADFQATPAAIKFVSYEPAIAHVDWSGWEFIDMLIIGGESGPGARPSHPDWFYDALVWCRGNCISPFFKQHGAWIHASQLQDQPLLDVTKVATGEYFWDDGSTSYRVSKKHAGHLLDGQVIREWPLPAGR